MEKTMINASMIKEHQEVVGSDGAHVGRVDHVMGDQIELAKLDLGSGLKHHMIPVSWVSRVDEHVHLSLSKDEAKARWTEKH
ncbi:DUF2171 domain-containing protein [Brevundimonas olei]|jgi:hypothetical protein